MSCERDEHKDRKFESAIKIRRNYDNLDTFTLIICTLNTIEENIQSRYLQNHFAILIESDVASCFY